MLSGIECPGCNFACIMHDTTQRLRKEKLTDDLRVAIKQNDLLYLADPNLILLNLNFTVFTTSTDSPNITDTVYVDKYGVTPINNHSVKASKRFFRIGTTEVCIYQQKKYDKLYLMYNIYIIYYIH